MVQKANCIDIIAVVSSVCLVLQVVTLC